MRIRSRGQTNATRWRPWLLATLPWILAWLIQNAAERHPHWVETVYGQQLYPVLSLWLNLLNRIVPFSIAELATPILALGALVGILAGCRQMLRGKVRPNRFLSQLGLVLLWGTGSAAILFLLLWGLNYQRPSLSDRWGLEPSSPPPSMEEWSHLGARLVAAANRSHARALGVAPLHPRAKFGHRLYAILEQGFLSEPMLGLQQHGRYGPPKPIHFSRLLTLLGVAGFYSPFTGEPHFNAEPHGTELPFSIAHEMAHQRGIAREDDANFAAFLATTAASDPFVCYTGYLWAVELVGRLAPLARDARGDILGQLQPGPRADLESQAAFWSRFQGPIHDLGSRVNHSYLRANSVESGIRNYDESVSLLLAYYRRHGASRSDRPRFD